MESALLGAVLAVVAVAAIALLLVLRRSQTSSAAEAARTEALKAQEALEARQEAVAASERAAEERLAALHHEADEIRAQARADAQHGYRS